MSKHLLRAAMALSLAAVAFSFTTPVRAQEAPKPEKPKRHQFTGLVESIDAKAGSVIVKKDAESKTFKTIEKTRYATPDKKDATIADIKVGDKVTVTYTEQDGVMTAHKIGVPESVKKKEPTAQ